MVFKFQRFQMALGSVVEQPIGFESTWMLGHCLPGGWSFKLDICGVFIEFCPRAKTISIILVPLKNGCEPE